MPTNERQLRFLAKVELEPAVQANVWQQAVEEAGNKIPCIVDFLAFVGEREKGKYETLLISPKTRKVLAGACYVGCVETSHALRKKSNRTHALQN